MKRASPSWLQLRSLRKEWLIGSLLAGFALKTVVDFRIPPKDPEALVKAVKRELIVDRSGRPLVSIFENDWNSFEQMRLNEFPPLLIEAFIGAEDRRFYSHWGVDWRARAAALYQALRAQRFVRGASTITEQVVRLIHPRPRKLWSRWIETLEAYALELRWDKSSILEFYLNQMIYSANRKGVLEASRYYFGRDLDTLNAAELLSLAVLVRAPGYLDPQKNPDSLVKRVLALGKKLKLQPENQQSLELLDKQGYESNAQWQLDVRAPHFAKFARDRFARLNSNQSPEQLVSKNTIETSLDGELQNFSNELLSSQIKKLHSANVRHGALLVADHQTGEVLAWSIAGLDERSNEATHYDTVQVPRQPGSALKPFLYGLALNEGMTAAHIIVDEPYLTAVGQGLHAIRNYSRENYGPVTLREALGNSLNIPAIKTVKEIGPAHFLDFLRSTGFSTLTRDSDFYGEGLALGSGEVSLFELVQSYTLFANEGHVRFLRVLKEEAPKTSSALLKPAVASLVTNILSDPSARQLEFGRNSILNLPIPTAVKTGTATDYRDAWAVGFNSRFIVGVWMGHLDRIPTDGNTGAKAPAMVLRGVMNFLARKQDWKIPALPLDPSLISKDLCKVNGQIIEAHPKCASFTEYFVPGTENSWNTAVAPRFRAPHVIQPVNNLNLAFDPRIPAHLQAFEFRMTEVSPGDRVEWILNGKPIALSDEPKYLWPIERGRHSLQAKVHRQGEVIVETDEIPFVVK